MNCRIKETNALTKLHEYWAKIVSSRPFTCVHYIQIEKTNPPPGGHVFSPIMTIFELVRDIYSIDAKNVASRVKMTPLSLAAMFFSPIRTIFELKHRHIQKSHVLIKFHEEWTKNVTSRVFTCFHYIHLEKIPRNVLTKFHTDWAKIVTSRVFTRNTVPPCGGQIFQRAGTIFELNQLFI
ncbi:hypothetical protein DPMN_137453 [Dreissena polymorpha]|uniref:Uncharacterized protein n=1 Tax=Dreissena polymorpha TaxID=45954 RepID=A0A9D4JEQ3_DREPO|nr:hypothetical protein DPMN_137453 [Dreissena polymorpha]